MILIGSFKFDAERNEYLGMVVKQNGREMTVLTIGSEATEHDILVWIKQTIDLMRAEGRTDVQAPDMYDRARALASLQ
jgi:hypothetical protein